jgi:hypothetical protein
VTTRVLIKLAVRVEMRAPQRGERGWTVPVTFTEEEALYDAIVNNGEPLPGYVTTWDANDCVDESGMREITVILEAG